MPLDAGWGEKGVGQIGRTNVYSSVGEELLPMPLR